MYLMKAAGATYSQVMKFRKHAFFGRPSEIVPDEVVLLSKNVADCAPTESQVQFIAKVTGVRVPRGDELEKDFPGVKAGERWEHVVDFYLVRQLQSPFNLSGIPGFNWKRYGQVQSFAKLDPADEMLLLKHLCRYNERLVLDFLNYHESAADQSS